MACEEVIPIGPFARVGAILIKEGLSLHRCRHGVIEIAEIVPTSDGEIHTPYLGDGQCDSCNQYTRGYHAALAEAVGT